MFCMVMFFLGSKSRLLAQNSAFRLTTPILVNGPFVALRETVHTHVGDDFLTFCSQVMAVFIKKKR